MAKSRAGKGEQADDSKSDRTQTTIDLTPEALASLGKYIDRRGGRGTKKFMLSKLVQWFADQPEPVKSVVIGWIDEDEGIENAYGDLLFKLSREIKSRAESRHHQKAKDADK